MAIGILFVVFFLWAVDHEAARSERRTGYKGTARNRA